MAFIYSPQMTDADTIEFLNEDKLTGTLSAMTNEGAIFTSPNYAAPLSIKKDSIRQIKFINKLETPMPHAELITLVNGDSLPCQVLSMEKGTVNISTWYAGDFNIARENIFSIRFGISEEQTIFTGSNDIKTWSDSSGWSSDADGIYTSKKSGTLARELPLPENFHINFDLFWKDSPNFVFRFCADSPKVTREDTYELIFNTAGIQIRQLKDADQSAPIANIDLNPASINAKQINIDLKVNRSDGSIILHLDHIKSGTYHNVFDSPKGKHIIFQNRASSGNTCTVKNLHITDWKDTSPTRHLSKVSPSEMDVIIESLGDRRSGKITRILKQENGNRIIQFADKHSSKPLMIPESYISLLYLAEPEKAPSHPELAFTANLTGYGSLQLEDTELSETKIKAHHPILGKYTLDRRALATITQNEAPLEE